MTKMNFKRLIICPILFVVISVLGAGKVELNVASNTGNIISEGDLFQIYITVTDINEAPTAPGTVPGASVKYFGHRSSSSSFVSTNGHTSQTFTNTYALTLKAEKRGKFSFGPITVGGVKSNVVSYTIGAPNQSPSIPGRSSGTGEPDPMGTNNGPTFIGKGNEQLFLRANISKTTAFEQEALVYTVKLYTTYNTIKFIGATDAPKFDGFVIEESSDISDQLTLETYQGKSYATAVIARYIIFPQMPGRLKIIGNKYTVSADAEEYYHDPFYSRLTVRRPVQLHVTPNDLTIDVKALPIPKPANFSGGVGNFTITSSVASNTAVANQAGAVTYTVKGEGNLKYITLPDLNALFPSEIEVFSPTTDVKTKVGYSNVSGSIQFDYSFMPMEAGNFNIPSVPLVYFNPVKGEYVTVTAKGFPLNVSRGKESSKSQAALSFSPKLMNNDSKLKISYVPYVYQFTYWLWYIIPLIIFGIVLFLYRKHLAEQSDLVALKSKRAAKMALRRLKKAFMAMTENNVSGFYDEMLKALWGYVGDKLKLPLSELNRNNVSGLLQEKNISHTYIDRFIKLLDDCEFAKFAPDKANTAMEPVYNEGLDVINDLEQGFKTKSINPVTLKKE